MGEGEGRWLVFQTRCFPRFCARPHETRPDATPRAVNLAIIRREPNRADASRAPGSRNYQA